MKLQPPSDSSFCKKMLESLVDQNGHVRVELSSVALSFNLMPSIPLCRSQKHPANVDH